MTTERPTYGVGEVIYPRAFDNPCMTCGDPARVHRYTVVSDTKMAPSGCDGVGASPCPCTRLVLLPVDAKSLTGTTVPPTREETWANYPDDAMGILRQQEAPTTRCGRPLCQAPIWWGTTRANNRRCPFDIRPDGARTGTSHWRTCRDRPEPTRKGGTRKKAAR